MFFYACCLSWFFNEETKDMESSVREECNLFDCIVELCDFLERSKQDAGWSKADMADSCKQRCHFMLKKALAYPATTSMSMSGWRLGSAEM